MQASNIIDVIISDTLECPEFFILINKNEPSIIYSVVADAIELDSLTLREAERRISERISSGAFIEITETYYSDNLDPNESLGYFRDIQPLYFTLRREIPVEVHASFNKASFKLRYSTNSSGALLFQEIATVLNVNQGDFLVILENGKRSSKISRNNRKIDIDQQKDTKLVIKPVTRGPLPVSVRVNAGEKISISVGADTTVEQLKELIDIECGLPCDTIKLVYEGDSLPDEAKLNSLGIKQGGSIVCYRTNRAMQESMGDIKFVDINNESSAKKIEFSKSAPEWRVARPGLCLEGKCASANCVAKGQYVVMNMGIGIFDMMIDRKKAVCPLCEQVVEFETCAFNNCSYSYVGRRFVGADLKAFKPQKAIPVGNFYLRFDPYEKDQVIWISLKIVTKKTEEGSDQPETCLSCKKSISKGSEDLMPCGHKIHKLCKKNAPMCLLCAQN